MVVARSARVSPFAGAPATPPRRASSASDWSTLFKMASSPHKIRFISIPWKGGPCSYVLSTPDFGKNLSETGTVPLFHPFSPLLRRPLFESRPPARPPPRSFNGRRSSILTLKGVPIWPSFPRTTLSRVRGFKPPSRGGAGG